MPFLNDDELTSLHKTIDKAEEDLSEVKTALENTNEELEEANETIESHDEELKKVNKSKNIQNTILAILAGIGLALAVYFYGNGSGNSSTIDINEIKKVEATRVLDSINALNDNYDDNNDSSYAENNSNSLDDNIDTVKNNISGQKIFSVQIGAFSQNNYTLLSETLAGISSNGDVFKYSIGLFNTLQEAQDFRRELVKIGFRDAFVASYIDGVRQEIEQPN